MKYFYHILRIIVGLVFIVSGLAKLYPIEPFENIFIDLGISNWTLAPFMARLVIAFEIFLGAAIVFSLWLKNKVYFLAQGTLLFFTGYLIYLLFTKGNNVDCGCFGSLIVLSPSVSIVKNVIMMAALFFIPKRYFSSGVSYGVILISSISLALPIVLNPIGIHNMQGVEVNEDVDFSGLPPLYETNKEVDFSKGEKVVAFFSYKCPHCINASRKFGLLNKKKNISNLYFVIGSKKEEGLLNFVKETEVEVPFIWMDSDDFFKYSGGSLPAIIYIEDGIMKKKWFGDRFDVDDIGKYLTD